VKKQIAIVAMGLAALYTVGCNMGSDKKEDPANDPLISSQPQISLVASNKEIVQGDTTTLTVDSRNTLGRNAQIEWTATGGEVQTDDSGRVARVRFDTPGVFTVLGRLLIDGQEVDREMMNINVRPLR
jgi:hypothetical protein